MEPTNPKLALERMLEHAALKHIEFSIFVSFFLQASRFFSVNNDRLLENILSLSDKCDLGKSSKNL